MTVPFQLIDVPSGVDSSANPPSYRRKYKAVGETSQTTVHSYVLSATPAVVTTLYGILYRQDVSLRQVAYNHFDVEVPYGPRKNESGQWTWDFDTTGGTVHITNGKEEIGRYPTASAPDQKGAIAVDAEQVQGTDIVIPAMKINVQYKHPQGVITLPQAKFLASITGCVNSTPMLTFAPGEVLFLGARGADGSDVEASVSYQFAMSANVSGLSIGGIADIAKKGWEVLWIRYKDATATGGANTLPVRIPEFAYVDRVYDVVDLATALGFGA